MLNLHTANRQAELAAREVEASWAATYQRSHAARLLRALDCYTQAYIFVRADGPRWAVQHINEAAIKMTGVSRCRVLQTAFWDLWQPMRAGGAPWEAYAPFVESGEQFTVPCLYAVGTTPPTAPIYTMSFRPATTHEVDKNTLPVGVPSDVRACSGVGDMGGLFFVQIKREEAPALDTRVATAGRRVVPLAGLRMGPLLGAGAYGRVYRGKYKGQEVAVKVIQDVSRVRMINGQPVEAALTAELAHPNIVRLLAHATTPASAGDLAVLGDGPSCCRGGPAGPIKAVSRDELWLLLEFCNRGTLGDAVDRGLFRTVPSAVAGAPDMRRIMATAADVAGAMAYLHSKSIMHGDLTGGNVLLKTASDRRDGFKALVSDFGLARDLNVRTRFTTHTYGTITHMPPELLAADLLVPAGDVYSWAVLVWEMLAGCRAWAALNYGQVINAVAIEGRSLQVPPTEPPEFGELVARCLHREHACRPPFAEIEAALRGMRAAPAAKDCPA